MPEAAQHIKDLLGLRGSPDPGTDGGYAIEFGHNSHELVTRVLSSRMVENMASDELAFRILTTDTEFYSITRQLNRLLELKSDRIVIEAVPIEPLESFPERFAAAARAGCQKSPRGPFDFVYCSQCVYSTQETIVPDVPGFAARVSTAMNESAAAECTSLGLFVLDGYHGFGAIPTDLAASAQSGAEMIYVSGLLKHVGSGANCAFMVLPPRIATSIRPLLTGWLADPSVLAAQSSGIRLGSEVGYMPGLSLMGSTPAFAPCLLAFNEVMRRWKERGITVRLVHAHVMRLHERFLSGLQAIDDQLQEQGTTRSVVGGITADSLHSLLPSESRSHTLVFDQPDSKAAKEVVDTLRYSHGIAVDSRKSYVRVGFGFNHNPEDVDRLLNALSMMVTKIDK